MDPFIALMYENFTVEEHSRLNDIAGNGIFTPYDQDLED